MTSNRLYEDKELAAALGTAKYHIDTAGLKEGETYVWFPTLGDSMTDKTPKSIPSGSLVLGRCLQLNSVSDIPLHRPIVVIIHFGGSQYCLLKSGCAIQNDSEAHDGASDQMLCLRSYNPAPRCDDLWVLYNTIKFVFVVEKVQLPNGKEFVPKQEEVVRAERNH